MVTQRIYMKVEIYIDLVISNRVKPFQATTTISVGLLNFHSVPVLKTSLIKDIPRGIRY